MASGGRCSQANSKRSIWSQTGSSSKFWHYATLSTTLTSINQTTTYFTGIQRGSEKTIHVEASVRYKATHPLGEVLLKARSRTKLLIQEQLYFNTNCT